MSKTTIDQGTRYFIDQSYNLSIALEAFLIDRKAQNLSAGTLHFYRVKLALFSRFCEGQAIARVDQVEAGSLRRFLLWLEERGNNPGGIHAAYRAVRTFLRWFEEEHQPDTWRNPIQRVKAPRVPQEPIRGVELDTVKAMLAACGVGFTGVRDRAILYSLLDTGARAAEFCAMDLDDLDLMKWAILIRRGKGRKPRNVFIGKTTRRAIRAYLKARQDTSPALWVTDEGERLSYSGLRQVIRRRAAAAGQEAPELHDFRRTFALAMLRNGADLLTVSRLLGHSSISTTQRYLNLVDADLQESHRSAGVVDRLK